MLPAALMLYTGPSIEQAFRRRQMSSAARQVWLYDAATRPAPAPDDARTSTRAAVPSGRPTAASTPSTKRRVRSTSGIALRIAGDPEAFGTPSEQVTHFVGRSRSDRCRVSGPAAISPSAWARQSLPAAPRRDRTRADRDPAIVHADFPGDRAGRSAALNDFALSPNGRDFAVVTRGGISVASIDGRDVKRIAPYRRARSATRLSRPTGDTSSTHRSGTGTGISTMTSIVDPDDRTFAQATRLAERRVTSGVRGTP